MKRGKKMTNPQQQRFDRLDKHGKKLFGIYEP